jgi:1-aminocyclopropane-1-carboxylate deaminase/D-cysteine desulfhydrase-like pyridoxal-dependent ACC family enzyme/DNA modification methylase
MRGEHTVGQASAIPGGATEASDSSGTSIFDPVLCELAYRWFCPPDGTILDPFAGGSVRGIVASKLGRRYIGVELRDVQVAANREQARTICTSSRSETSAGAEAKGGDFTPEYTPVEELPGGFFAKREDKWSRSGASGAKSRTMFRLAESRGSKGIVSAGARYSPQIERAALVAKALGIPARVHTSEGSETPEMQTCRMAGAEVVQHTFGRLSVIKSRFKKDAEAHPNWLAIPFGVGIEEYADDVAAQVASIPDAVQRIVVPCGSGMTLAGILRGVEKSGRRLPVLGVSLGHDPAEYLERFAPRAHSGMFELVKSEMEFEAHAAVTNWLGIELDPMYEAKCIPFLQAGDCLWVVGIRENTGKATGSLPAMQGPLPVWINADSRDIPEICKDIEADFVFTCPPYADLEVYSDDPKDLSTLDYAEFLTAYREIVAAAVGRLKNDRFAGVVVGDVRDKNGIYRNFVSDTISAFQDAGAMLYNEAILVTAVGSLPIRVGKQFESGRKLGKTHQNFLVFIKGNPQEATQRIGPVEAGTDLGGGVE